MSNVTRQSLTRHFVLLLLFTLVLRTILLWPLGLNDDEAYYWMWSHMPSLSYFDNTPGAGWFLIPFNFLLGDSVFTLRLASGLTAALTALAMTLAATELSPTLSTAQRQWALWLSAVSGLVLSMTQVWTPDAPLLLFSSLAFWQLFRAVEYATPSAWIYTGVFFALALLAKANTGLYIAFIGLWMLWYAPARKQLLTPWPWIAFVIIVASLVPVLIWNANHDWAFIRFQGGHVFAPESATGSDQPEPFRIHWKEITALLVAYLGFAGPVVVFAIYRFVQHLRMGNVWRPAEHLAYSLAFSTTGLFLAIAVYKKFTANWALVSLLLLFIIGIGSLVTQVKRRWVWIQAAFALPVLLLVIALNYIPATVAKSPNWRNGLVWDQIYATMRAQQQKLGDDVLLAAVKYQDASQLAFRERERWSQLPDQHPLPALNLVGRSNHYAYVWPQATYRGRDLLVIYDNRESGLKSHFCELENLGEFEAKYQGKMIRKFRLYLGRGFLGRPDVNASFDRSICINGNQDGS